MSPVVWKQRHCAVASRAISITLSLNILVFSCCFSCLQGICPQKYNTASICLTKTSALYAFRGSTKDVSRDLLHLRPACHVNITTLSLLADSSFGLLSPRNLFSVISKFSVMIFARSELIRAICISRFYQRRFQRPLALNMGLPGTIKYYSSVSR